MITAKVDTNGKLWICVDDLTSEERSLETGYYDVVLSEQDIREIIHASILADRNHPTASDEI